MGDGKTSPVLDKWLAMFEAFATEDNMVSRALMEEMERRKAAGMAAAAATVLCDRCGESMSPNGLTFGGAYSGNLPPAAVGYHCDHCGNCAIKGTIENNVGVLIKRWDHGWTVILTNGKSYSGELKDVIELTFSTSEHAKAWRQRYVFDNPPPEPKPDPTDREYPRGALILPLP
jgi:hypothetical protein